MWYFRFTEPWGIADKVDGEIEKTKKLGFNLVRETRVAVNVYE